MTSQDIARTSQRLAAVTLGLMILMLLLNTIVWLLPELALHTEYGLSFALTRQVDDWGFNLATLSWWQALSGLAISSIPLLVLIWGLYHLRLLFQSYAQGQYFTVDQAAHLDKVGQAVLLWVLLKFLCEPLMGFILTATNMMGERFITLTVGADSVIALFLGACIMLIAQILQKASEIAIENQQFV